MSPWSKWGFTSKLALDVSTHLGQFKFQSDRTTWVRAQQLVWDLNERKILISNVKATWMLLKILGLIEFASQTDVLVE